MKMATEGTAAGRAASADGIYWELRPSGMLVQLRDLPADAVAAPKVKVKVSYGSCDLEVAISPDASFGDLKKLLIEETGLQPKEQRLLFKGKEKHSSDYLNVAGVKDKSKIVVFEDPASREKRLLELRRNNAIARACKAIAEVKQEVDKLAGQLSVLEGIILNGSKVADKDLEVLTEKLMYQLLKLEGIKGDGDAKIQRRSQVRSVQNHVETIDRLRAHNAIPNPVSSTIVTTNWEKFDGTASSLPAPPSTSTVLVDWEVFE